MVSVFSRAAAGLIFAAAVSASAEDLTIVSTASGPGGAATTTQYMTSDKIKSSDGQNDSIIDLASGTMTVINHKKKEYYEMTAAEINAAFEQMSAQMKQMEEQMKNAPAFLKKQMGGDTQVTVEKGSSPKKIAGYDCDHYVATMGASGKAEYWVTKSIKPPTQYYDAFKIQMSALGPAGQTMGKVFEEMKKIDGFPLASSTSIKMMGMNLNTSNEATEVTKGKVPASAFEIPSGYKKGQSPLKGK
jgi:hypothetical protein